MHVHICSVYFHDCKYLEHVVALVGRTRLSNDSWLIYVHMYNRMYIILTTLINSKSVRIIAMLHYWLVLESLTHHFTVHLVHHVVLYSVDDLTISHVSLY